MNVQKEEKVEDSLELPMRSEEGAIVEDLFDKIQEQDDDEEEEVSLQEKMHFATFKMTDCDC